MLREVKLKEDEGYNKRYGALSNIPTRIWYVIGTCVTLFTLSRMLFTTSEPVSLYSKKQFLSSLDYLNASAADPAPFEFCPAFGPGDEIALRRGQWGLLKSRFHTGTGARVQRVIQKAMAGQPITISVLGGSVTACHGAGDDPVAPKCWPAKFFEWWNKHFPHPASELTNGAQRRTDSAYFAYCSQHHLPDHTDLVVLEFDAADPNDPQWLTHFELLVRSLLTRDDEPAVIILGHFAPQVQIQNGFAGPELLHTIVAQFYDVPHISAKGMLYNEYLNNPEESRAAFYHDPILANLAGHELIADVLISYMQSQICAGWAATMGHAFDVPYMGATLDPITGLPLDNEAQAPLAAEGDSDDIASEGGGIAAKQRATHVPQAFLFDKPSDILKFREVKPFCVSANDLINPLPPSHFFGSGWHAHHPAKGEREEKHYWYAEIAGSRMRVPVELSAGDVGIYYIQNPEESPLGRAACWVDDNYAGAMELSGTAEVGEPTPTLTIIDPGVSAGSHFVECVLLGTEGQTTAPFKMLGVFTT